MDVLIKQNARASRRVDKANQFESHIGSTSGGNPYAMSIVVYEQTCNQ